MIKSSTALVTITKCQPAPLAAAPPRQQVVWATQEGKRIVGVFRVTQTAPAVWVPKAQEDRPQRNKQTPRHVTWLSLTA